MHVRPPLKLAVMAVLQWNLRGLRPNIAELSLLLAQHNPNILCLQETKLPDGVDHQIKHFSGYHQYFSENQIASGGNTIYVNRHTPSRQIQLTTSLQAVAVRVNLHRPSTICSVYIPQIINSKSNN